MIRFALPRILLFLTVLLPMSFAADDHSASPPAAPPPLHQNISPSFAVVAVALVCSFLFISFFAFYLRFCSDAYVVTEIPVRTAVDCSTCGPRGIDRKILDTFPILVYSPIKDLKIGKEALECAICLSEFKDHETLRLLPNCSHVFHPDCIDAWLASHVTCPVCRANLKPDRRGGEKEIAIAIPSETNAHNVFGESSVSRSEVNNNNNSAVETEQAVVLSPNYANEEEEEGGRNNFLNLVRSHSTGHSLCEAGKKMERYTLRLPEEVRKQILENHEGIRRSASYDVFWSARKGYKNNEEEGSSRGKLQTKRLQLVISMTPPFVSRSNAMNT